MSAKRKWEIGAWLSFVAVLAVVIGFAVRHWLLNEALVRAVWDSYPEEAQRLLRQGANPNLRDARYHEHLLTYSLTSGATLKVLLQGGANPDARTKAGNLPIVRAAGASYLDVVQILLRYGAAVNAVELDGETALLAATAAGASPEVVRTLLDAGADINARNRTGLTPLRLAQQQFELSGTNVGGKWRAEVTRRQRARRREIVRLLKDAGAVH